MWTLKRKVTFEAAHRLPLHDGKCSRLHGHSWTAWIEVESQTVHLAGPKTGMVVDFGDLDAIVSDIREQFLDHYYLNESLKMENPTSELVAQWIFERLIAIWPWKYRTPAHWNEVRLTGITIEETCRSQCQYKPN